jgi:hypothetical protein
VSLADAFGRDQFLQRVSNCAPIAFVVDDDISGRESLNLLIRYGQLTLHNDFTLAD